MKQVPGVLLLSIVLLSVYSCRSTKSIQTAISKKDSVGVAIPDSASRRDSLMFMKQVYEGVTNNMIDYTTFSAKVKVAFEGSDGKKNDFNAFIRIQKDSVIWMSVNALLGIEAFRVLITPDSVKVLNKLDKEVQLRSVNYLQEITRLPFGFKELQDMLLGHPIFFDNNIVSYLQNPEIVSVLRVGPAFTHLLSVKPNSLEIVHSKLDDVNPIRARTADISYGDYETVNGKPFSTYRRITVSEKAKLDIEMKYKQYEFNVPLNFPFGIPKNYKLQ